MPFTFSHPVIILPFGYLPKRWLSSTGLVIGSMVPDFEYFIRMRVYSVYSHTLQGLFGFDLPLGILLVLVFNVLVKDCLINHLPNPLNQRLYAFKKVQRSYPFGIYLIILSVSVIVGAATHLIWDAFTHPTGYFVCHIPFLTSRALVANHAIYVYKVLQHISSIVGAIAISIAIWKLPKQTQPIHKHYNIISFWLLVTGVAVITLIVRLLTGLTYRQYGNLIVSGITGICLGLITASGLFLNKEPAHQ
jgi:hypothetical protein